MTLFRLRAVGDFLFVFCFLINNDEAPVCHIKTKYWHTQFSPNCSRSWIVFKWILSKPAVCTYFVCIWSFGRSRSSKCTLLVSFRERCCAGAHTRTFQPGEQRLLYIQRFIIKHVQQFSNCKDGILQQSTDDWSDSDVKFWSGRNECAPLWREGSCARRNTAIILRSQKKH